MVVLLLQLAKQLSSSSYRAAAVLAALPSMPLASFGHACKERRGLRWCMAGAAAGGHLGRHSSGVPVSQEHKLTRALLSNRSCF